MRFVRDYWLQIVLTCAAFGLGYALDARDGAVSIGVLALGTMIAAAGFFGGSLIASKVKAKYDHA